LDAFRKKAFLSGGKTNTIRANLSLESFDFIISKLSVTAPKNNIFNFFGFAGLQT
jgi:hypothetical protein